MIIHKYNFKLVCRCPNDKSVNIYDVKIKSDDQIQVEEFNKFQKKIYNELMYQEEIYELLNQAYDNVTLVGNHLNVEVVSSE